MWICEVYIHIMQVADLRRRGCPLQNLLFTELAIDVVVRQDDVLIKWLEMEAWNGIFERTYKIEHHQPHSIVLFCEKELVEFQYGFVF